MNSPKTQLKELSREEMESVRGGIGLPGQFQTPTWKYVDGTPQWAIDAARAAGYEVEKI